jgi:hypothetical protein
MTSTVMWLERQLQRPICGRASWSARLNGLVGISRVTIEISSRRLPQARIILLCVGAHRTEGFGRDLDPQTRVPPRFRIQAGLFPNGVTNVREMIFTACQIVYRVDHIRHLLRYLAFRTGVKDT